MGKEFEKRNFGSKRRKLNLFPKVIPAKDFHIYTLDMNVSPRAITIGCDFVLTEITKVSSQFGSTAGQITDADYPRSEINIEIGGDNLFSDLVDIDTIDNALHPFKLSVPYLIKKNSKIVIDVGDSSSFVTESWANTIFAFKGYLADIPDKLFRIAPVPMVYVARSSMTSSGTETEVVEISRNYDFDLTKMLALQRIGASDTGTMLYEAVNSQFNIHYDRHGFIPERRPGLMAIGDRQFPSLIRPVRIQKGTTLEIEVAGTLAGNENDLRNFVYFGGHLVKS